MNSHSQPNSTHNGNLRQNGGLSQNGCVDSGHDKRLSRRRRRGVIFKTRILSFLTGVFIGRPGCGCCWCFTADDDVIPFWSRADTETNISVNDDYTNETFESERTQTRTQASASKKQATAAQPATNKLAKYAKENGFGIGSEISPNNNNFRKNSESESEDSFSVAHSETSDGSDVEIRIRALSDELKRRKFEAERLKQEHQRRQKEKLKQKEEYLKKQIENYDSYISHVKTELNHGSESPERLGSPVRPHIKPQSHAITNTTERPKSVDKVHLELEVGKAPPVPPRVKHETQSKSKTPKSSVVNEKPTRSLKEKTDKSITEVISEELSSNLEVTERSEVKEGLQLKLDLQQKDDEKILLETPRSARDKMDTARSIPEIPEDYTEPTDLAESFRQDPSQVEGKVESELESPNRPPVSVRSDTAKSVVSEYTEDGSEASSALHTDRSDRSDSSYRSDRSKTYTDDYTSDSYSSATKSPRSKVPSERSAGQTSMAKSTDKSVKSLVEVDENVQTQDDISEVVSEISDDESKSSEPLFRFDPTKTVESEPSQQITKPTNKTMDSSQEKDEDKDEQMLVVSQDTEDKDIDKIISSASDALEDFLGDNRDYEHSAVNRVTIEDAGKSEDIQDDFDEEITNIQPDLISQSDDEEYGRSKSLVEELQEAEKQEKQEKAESSKAKEINKASDLAVQNLLNEALSQMMTIRSRKHTTSQESSDGERADTELNEPSSEDLRESEKAEKFEGKETEAIERPVSPLGYRPDEGNFLSNRELQFQDDDPYNFDQDVDDPWNDDDLALIGIHGKPAPPYPDQSGPISSDELKLDLNKLNEPIKPETIHYVVPHKEKEVAELTANAVDVFWERRRYGEPWDNVEPPSSYFTPDDKGADIDSHSKYVYKRLVFDMTAHVLRDMYKEEDEDVAMPPWMKQRLSRRKYHKRKSPPTTIDSLKPIVETHILQMLGLGPEGRADRNQTRKWATRKKKDRVDQILVQELREEEPQWVNYDEDELSVKIQLTNTLFESLLSDTAMALQPALNRWSKRSS